VDELPVCVETSELGFTGLIGLTMINMNVNPKNPMNVDELPEGVAYL
jgi:hypothetical protein